MTFSDPIEFEASLPIRPSSPAWKAIIRSIYGTMQPEDLELWRELTGRQNPKPEGYRDALFVVGRRGGKSETTARLALFEGLYGNHEHGLAPGQEGQILVISPLRAQSDEILNYVKGLCTLTTDASATADGVLLPNGIRIRIQTASAVGVSGSTVCLAILDEFAKFPGAESASPDTEILNSLRPALTPVIGSPTRRLIAITSAYIKAGLAYETDEKCFGVESSHVLVAHGNTEVFNPNVDLEALAHERERDLAIYQREYECIWADSIIESFFGTEAINACVMTDTRILPRDPSKTYVASIDAAFTGDNFALVIAHGGTQDGKPAVVIDLVHAWKPQKGAPLIPTDVVRQSAGILRAYGVKEVHADQHNFTVLKEMYAAHGVTLKDSSWNSTNKPARYSIVRNAMLDRQIRILDSDELLHELHGIQSELTQSGGNRIGARRGHDDLASAMVLVASEILHNISRFEIVKGAHSDLAMATFYAALTNGANGVGGQRSWSGGAGRSSFEAQKPQLFNGLPDRQIATPVAPDPTPGWYEPPDRREG